MLEDTYRSEMDALCPDEAQMERLLAVMGGKRRRGVSRHVRTVLMAAAVVAALVTTVAAAYFMGAFDFLKEQTNYAALGMNEIYEKYAYKVNSAVTTQDGDVFTVERVAMDNKTCTVFYSIRFKEPVVSPAELKAIQSDGSPDMSKIERWSWSSFFELYAGGEEISGQGYDNSFEPQQYLADPSTFYGAWRCLLERPLTEGENVEMQVRTYENRQPSGAADVREEHLLPFAAHPIASEHVALGILFERQLSDRVSPVEVRAIDRSPLGTFLTLREEKIPNYLGLDFALRDADTGGYIPCGEVVVSHYGDPEGYMDNIFELYGDMSGLKNLELIPVGWGSGTSQRKTVPLDELSATDSGNPAGGYAPTAYEAKDGKLYVTMTPQGAVTPFYVRLHYGVDFLDAEGNKLFTRISTQRFKSRTDGTVTRVETPDAESYQRDVDKVAQLSFPVFKYELNTGRTVRIPLQ